MHIRGDDILKQQFLDGAIISFDCALGYTADRGSATVTCRAGEWSVLTLECEGQYFFPKVYYKMY